jgi:putative ABC transport system permease protein
MSDLEVIMPSSKPTFSWLLLMAWRESRTHRLKLILFLSAIVIGVAAQVSISSLRDNLKVSIDSQSKELLG